MREIVMMRPKRADTDMGLVEDEHSGRSERGVMDSSVIDVVERRQLLTQKELRVPLIKRSNGLPNRWIEYHTPMTHPWQGNKICFRKHRLQSNRRIDWNHLISIPMNQCNRTGHLF